MITGRWGLICLISRSKSIPDMSSIRKSVLTRSYAAWLNIANAWLPLSASLVSKPAPSSMSDRLRRRLFWSSTYRICRGLLLMPLLSYGQRSCRPVRARVHAHKPECPTPPGLHCGYDRHTPARSAARWRAPARHHESAGYNTAQISACAPRGGYPCRYLPRPAETSQDRRGPWHTHDPGHEWLATHCAEGSTERLPGHPQRT